MTRNASPLRDRMIFLVGSRRSGTNWLQRIVAAHPDVATVPAETYLFSRGIAPLRERFHHGVRGSSETGFIYMDHDDLVDALRTFCDRALLPYLEAVPGAKRLVERTPEHALAVDVIGEIYPDAHIVHIVRDGRDVARSLLSQTWPSAPTTMEDAAEEWRGAVEAAERAGAMLERYRTVSYERMLADPLPCVTELYEWLGLNAAPGVVEGALIEAEVRFNVDPRAPVIASGKWQESFSEADLTAFTAVAGDTLHRLGYGPGAPASGAKAAAAPPATRRKRLRGGSSDDDPATAHRRLMRSVVRPSTENLKMFRRVVAAFNTRRMEELTSMVTDSVAVHFIGRDDEWKGRGPAAWDRLRNAVLADAALAGRQERGDVYVGVPVAVAVMKFTTGDGTAAVRVVTASFTRDRVSSMAYYQL